MATPKFNADECRTLFAQLADLGQIHIVCIHPNGLKIVGKDFATYIDNAVEYAGVQNAAGLNVYWTVNRVRDNLHKKASKADVVAARFVHVDLDPPKTGGAFDKAAIIEGLGGLDCPPSFIVDSGGGLNVYWRLDGLYQNLDSIEGINVQVRDMCDADHCWNIDRIMRVPGTVNWPDSRKLARGRTPVMAKFAVADDGTAYQPQELAASFPPAKLGSTSPTAGLLVMPDSVVPITPDDLGLSALDPIRLAITEPPAQDRSGDGVAAARLLANAGFADAQILGILLNPANAVAAHYLGQRDPKRAAARTVQLIRTDGPPEGEALPDPVPQMSQADFDIFVNNMRAKVREQMVPEGLGGEPEPTSAKNAQVQIEGKPAWLTALGDNPIAQFVEYVCETAPSPQPWVTLGAALTVFGTAAGRRYAGPTNLRTNLYAIGICDSGGGKDHPIKMATELMVKAGEQKKMGGSKIASGQAMITDLTNSPSLMYAIDEVGFLISSAADRKRAPKHATEIIDNMTALYSMAGSTFLGTSYADQSESGGKPRKVIEQPCLSLFGVTTPSVFWGSLTSSNVLDGSLARMVIFQSENDYPDPQFDIERRDMPARLIMAVQRLVKGADGHNALPMGESNTVAPKPFHVPYADEEARAKAVAMRLEQTDMLRANKGTSQTSVIARLAENAAKIALIKAVAANPLAPSLSAADLEWGMMVARQSVDSLLTAIKEKVADNLREKDVKDHLAVILGEGLKGATGSLLSQKLRGFDKRRRMEILDELNETGEIISVAIPKKTKAGKQGYIHYDAKLRPQLESAGLEILT